MFSHVFPHITRFPLFILFYFIYVIAATNTSTRIELIVAESQNGSIEIGPDRVNYFELSASHAWENWHRHLFDVQLTCRGIIELTRAYFGERYEGLFLHFLGRLGDGTLNRSVTWAFRCQHITWQGLEHQLSRLEDADTVGILSLLWMFMLILVLSVKELSDRIQRIRKSLETLRFHAMFPGAHKFDIKGCGVNDNWALDCSVEDIYNIGVVIEDGAEPDELDPLLDRGKWKEFLSKANGLVAKRKGVNVGSERSANSCSAEILFDVWKYSAKIPKATTLLNLNISWKPHNCGKA